MEEAHFTEEIRSEYYAQEADDLPEEAYPLSYELFGKHQSKDKAILTETKNPTADIPSKPIQVEVKTGI